MLTDIIEKVKVAIDISPIQTGHKFRGIGSYTEKLISALKEDNWANEFEFFQNPKSPPAADVIHYPYFDLFFHTLPIKRSVPTVVTIHDVIPLVFPEYFPVGIKGYINLFFQKRALKNVNAVICDSKTSKEDIVSKLSFPRQKIKVIYLAPGKNFRKIKLSPKQLKIISQYKLPKDFILYVGDVNWNKNVENLIRAVKIAKANLVMVGKALTDSNLPQTLMIDKTITELSLGNQIIKTGYVEEGDLIALYNLARITVLPSYYEGFGLPVLESMACGTPVVCSNLASLTEITGNVAVYCDPTDSNDIAKKISYVLNLSGKKLDVLSQKCIENASKYNWEKVAKETIEVYKFAQSINGNF